MNQIHDGKWGRIEVRVIAGMSVFYLTCPRCGVRAEIDDEQLYGKVSVDHTDTGCSYHETHDFTEPTS